MTYRSLPVTSNGYTRDIGIYDPPSPVASEVANGVNLSGRIEPPDAQDALGWGLGGAIGGALLALVLNLLTVPVAYIREWSLGHFAIVAVGEWLPVPMCFIAVFGLRLLARERQDCRAREAMPPARIRVATNKKASPVIVARRVETEVDIERQNHLEKLFTLVSRAADGNPKMLRRDGTGPRTITVQATGHEITLEEQKRLYDELAEIGILVKGTRGWGLADPAWSKAEVLAALVEALPDE
jgi:hypothetical protein